MYILFVIVRSPSEPNGQYWITGQGVSWTSQQVGLGAQSEPQHRVELGRAEMGVVEAEITRRRLCILRKRVLRIFSVSKPSTAAGGVFGGEEETCG